MNTLNLTVSYFYKTELIVMVVLATIFFVDTFYLWSVLNILQLITYMILIDVSLPAHLLMFMR